MKKITVFVLSILALASAASAQMVTKQIDFTNHCDAFKWQNIIIDGVNLRPKQAVTAIAVGATAVVTVGTGSTANVVASCPVMRGFKSIDVDFTSNPTFAACFYMQDAMFKSLPIQETIKGQLTFKGEKRTGFIIYWFKMQ